MIEQGDKPSERVDRVELAPINGGDGAAWCSPAARYVVPVVVFLSLSLPKINQGEFSVDTGWYAAIAHQAWRDAMSGTVSALWTLMGVGGQEGTAYFNKPPLGFWIHGLCLHVFGPELWAARLPSVMAGCLGIVLLVRHATRTCGGNVGVVAGLVLATTLEYVRHTHAVSLDLWHSVFLCGMLGVCATTLRHRSQETLDAVVDRASASRVQAARFGYCTWIVAGGFLGLGLMTKPLLGLVGAAIVFGVFILTGGWRAWRRMVVTLGFAMLIALPWHISMVLLHGDAFTAQYFGSEVVDRAAGNLANTNRDAASVFYYLIELAKSGWPWLVTTVLAIIGAARGQALSRSAGVSVLLITWLAVWLVVLSLFPDKRPRYMLVLYAPAAWLSAQWIVMLAPHVVGRSARAAVKWAAPAAVVAGVTLSLSPVRLHRPQSEVWDRFFGVIAREPSGAVWQGGFGGSRAARMYLNTGHWPMPTHNTAGNRLPGRSPPTGAMIVYHERDGLGPGANEAVLFQEGELTITRLGDGGWNPKPMP